MDCGLDDYAEMTGEEVTRKIKLYSHYTQWRIQGRGPRARPPLIFRTKLRPERSRKIFFETGPPPYPPNLRVWITVPPPPSMIHHCYWIAFRVDTKENLPGGLLRFILAGYVPLASQNPYPIIVYSVVIL